jgi:hypothetical protein
VKEVKVEEGEKEEIAAALAPLAPVQAPVTP